jgi:predicted TIM-barrel fold metal-dependent hydrolase
VTWKSEAPFPPSALTRPSFNVPALACDTHAHVFGSPDRYPPAPAARYTHPPQTDTADYRAVRARLGMQRGVLVQPSYYAFDNSCMLDALAAEPANLRGVAMIDASAALPDLDDWHRRGVRGLRADLFRAQALGRGLDDMWEELKVLAAIARERGWSLDLYAPGTAVGPLATKLAAFPVAVSVAHMGYFHPSAEESAMFPAFLATAKAASNLWIKLTGTYRLAPPDQQSLVDSMARTLVDACPDRLLWGSDWPHVLAHPVDTGILLQRLASWCPDERARARILVENPAHLYWR